MREAARLEVVEGGGTREPTFGRGRTVYVDQSNLRPEARLEDPAHAASSRPELVSARSGAEHAESPAPRPDGGEPARAEASPRESTPAHRTAAPGPARPRRPATWTEPDIAERPASYAIYRPETGNTTREPAPSRVRTEAK
jgi:hypothetical protein